MQNKSISVSETENHKIKLASDVLNWYEHELGIEIKEPIMEDTKWNIWGGVYYAASLYTTIGMFYIHSYYLIFIQIEKYFSNFYTLLTLKFH